MTRWPGSPATTPFIRAGSTRSPPTELPRRHAPDPELGDRASRAPSSQGGIVAAQSRTAATVGAEVLAAGGNAVDAAVATALALAAVEPWNSGLGGIGFMVVHRAGADHAEAIDFGPVAPRGLDPAAYPLTGATKTELFTWPQVAGDRNIHGPLAFAIPSAVRGYAMAVERFGRMPWRELAAPAAALARQGLPVDWFTTVKVASAAAELRLYDESRRIWLPDGLPPVCPPERDTMNLPLGRLADTLERLAAAGPDDFYTGDIAHSIAADVHAAGGVLAVEDLALCRARAMPALAIPYRGAILQGAPGMTAGPTLAFALERLGRQHFSAAPDLAYFTAVIEALRAAYADRLDHAGDVEAGLPTSTTHITAIDRDGTIAALTTTLLSSFGSRYVLPGTGILMNNGRHVVRPASGAAEFDAARQARADQYVPDRGHARRAAMVRRRRLGRPAHPRRGLADGELCRRFRHRPAGGGAPPADRRQRRRAHLGIDRRCPAADRRPALAPSPARASSSTASSRPGSLARTSCCATMTGSITASPT